GANSRAENPPYPPAATTPSAGSCPLPMSSTVHCPPLARTAPRRTSTCTATPPYGGGKSPTSNTFGAAVGMAVREEPVQRPTVRQAFGPSAPLACLAALAYLRARRA